MAIPFTRELDVDIRALQIVRNVGGLGWNFLLLDPSIAVRWLQPLIGFYSLFDAPLGHGAGSFSIYQEKYFHESGLDRFFAGYAYDRVIYEFEAPISVLGQYLTELGLFFILFLHLIISNIKSRHRIFIVLYVTIGLVQAQPIVYPIGWLLIAMCAKHSEFR